MGLDPKFWKHIYIYLIKFYYVYVYQGKFPVSKQIENSGLIKWKVNVPAFWEYRRVHFRKVKVVNSTYRFNIRTFWILFLNSWFKLIPLQLPQIFDNESAHFWFGNRKSKWNPLQPFWILFLEYFMFLALDFDYPYEKEYILYN